MKFGVFLPTQGVYCKPDLIKDMILAVEKAGDAFDCVWFGDHVVLPAYVAPALSTSWPDPYIVMSTGAAITKRLRFGNQVMVAPYRHPLVHAKMVSTMDWLSGGRINVMVSTGYLSGEFEALGIPVEDRGARTDEYIKVMKQVWSEEGPNSFEGHYVNYHNINVYPKPIQRPHPPLWICGNTKAVQRRAVREGSGWHTYTPHLKPFADGVSYIKDLRREAGKTGPFVFSQLTPSMRIIEPQKGESLPPVASRDIQRRGATSHDTEVLAEDYTWTSHGDPVASDGRPMFAGTYQQVSEDIQRFVEVGMNYMVIRFWAQSLTEDPRTVFFQNLERFAAKIAPLFKNA